LKAGLLCLRRHRARRKLDCIGLRRHPPEQPTMDDKTILQHITELVEEEKRLRGPQGDAVRIRDVEEQLDQCWDLLRQRRALREFGEDPDQAQVRDAQTVETYKG
jgi:hypothetical protein